MRDFANELEKCCDISVDFLSRQRFECTFSGGSLNMFYIACPLSITILFLTASIPMMEKRMLLKRPSYQGVIDNIPMLIPFTKC